MGDSRDSRLRSLLAEHAARIRAIVRARCPQMLGIDPDEVEQDVRIRLWQAMTDENKIDQPASYLYQTTMSVIVDHLRRRKARPDLANDEDASTTCSSNSSTDPQRAAASSQLGAALHLALAALPERRRRPVQLHLQGFGTQEVGRLMHMTEPAARNLIYRGLDELRECLRSEGWSDE